MKNKFSIYALVMTIVMLSYIWLGIYLIVNNPIDAFALFFYLLFFAAIAMMTYDAVINYKSSRPTKYCIVEVEKWDKDDYKKLYFVESEYIQSIYLYGLLYKKNLIKPSTDYAVDFNYYETEENAMNSILEDVKSYIRLTKKQENKVIKSIKKLKEFNMDELIEMVNQDVKD